MPEQKVNGEREPSAAREEPERYLGSVRFFKHAILLAVAALILVPAVLAVFWYVRFCTVRQEYASYVSYVETMEDAPEEPEGETAGEAPEESEEEASGETPEEPEGEASDEETLVIPFAVDLDDWKYLLVNDTHPLDADFTPSLADTKNGKEVDLRIKDDLERMLDDAREAGYDPLICSAYRDYSDQQELVQVSIEKLMGKGLDYREAFFQTKEQIALTGTSEHHTGLAVDIVGVEYQNLDEGEGDTGEAQWLMEHAHEYGFILRYPSDKTEVTGIAYEPWHFRYVRAEAAAFMKKNNLCLEEFIELAGAQYQQSAEKAP